MKRVPSPFGQHPLVFMLVLAVMCGLLYGLCRWVSGDAHLSAIVALAAFIGGSTFGLWVFPRVWYWIRDD